MRFVTAILLACLAGPSAAWAQAAPLPPREVPAKTIPVPGTVSPALRAIIAQPLRTNWDKPPTTPDGWKQLSDGFATLAAPQIGPMSERLRVTVAPTTIDGVRAYTITPTDIPAANRERIAIHVHGGCYVLNPREAALPEAMLLAGFGRMKVIAVDYRMPPEAFFPAALDDGMTVYKAVLRTTAPDRIAVFGSSAGGALTLAMMLRAKAEGLPLPGAIVPGTPMSDATQRGDSFQTNARVDNVLVSPAGFCDAATKFYAAGHDLTDPLLSPINGDVRGFPPTILTTGTRDLLLSNTVRMHRKLRQAGVEAALQVFEGQSHAQFYRDDRVPEVKEAFEEIASFLDRHLAR
ncbi:alpha/beta hydrolase [Methylobacterium sp. WL30]|uniref:alpha/beta hydrolase n=1 Tax=unclassified Methylobacterium TaxID=2615210 RepID=UPI0011C7309F|nr:MULTISPECIES: alpha/beta hydrolase [unclassified Methylobacterium]TXN41976.1 alpha/beta hydrolase [Methylobacterium sp. WL93]TXN51995.1 alpha/beta hydrolase [Methylobacterium sp. WL119]TXN68069.1 alpha/beta hydrolase [Methylobacterium sp. WL30]